MGSPYEVEVTVGSARDLKNVNWRNGDLKPYAVLWIDSGAKVSTRVDLDNGESPSWDEKVLVPLPPASRLQDAVLYIDVVHANAGEGVKPLVGSARLPLRDVIDDAGIGGKASRNLKLKRPSGRPQGKLDVRVAVREPSRYYDSGAAGGYPAPAGYAGAGGAYGSSRDSYGGYGGVVPGGYGAGAAAVGGYGAAYATAAPPAGYAASYGAAQPPQAAYGSGPAYGASPAYGAPPPTQAVYGSAQPAYGSSTTAYVDPAKKKKGLGVGGGLAVGAAAGVLGGLALAGGASYLEDKFEDEVAERVEEDQYGGGYDDFGGDDGDY